MIARMSDLVPIEQKQVMFYEDEVTAVRMSDGTVYVPIRPLCEHLGVAWSAQRLRINRDPVLSEVVTAVIITITTEGATPTQSQETLCLPLDFVSGWLFGINASRVNEDVRERLIRYQRECYKVLANAFVGTAVANAPSTLVQVREMGLAIARMAEEQMAFDRRLGTAEVELRLMTERLTAVEEKFGDTAVITEDQASQISQAVKAVALALGKKTKQNEFGAVYGQLYRQYGITSYKTLPAHKFKDALNFLTEWHQTIITDTAF